MNQPDNLDQQISALVVYQGVLQNPVGQAFLRLLEKLRSQNKGLILRAYGQWFQAIAAQQQSWQDFLVTQILQADNPFTQQAQNAAQLPDSLTAAAQYDLRLLQQLYQLSGSAIQDWVSQVTGQPIPVWEPPTQLFGLTNPLTSQSDWSQALPTLVRYYQQQGTGLFNLYRALRWQSGELVGIAHPDPVSLNSLVGYEYQRDLLLKNTEFLLAGYSALHVLLYGSRGSGKSSLIKAILNHYRDRSLRLIEVSKTDLKDLSTIAELLRDLPLKFILFVDDLSFEEDDEAFKALKVVLEGNVTARPQNLVVYATSNRRHLIREFHGDRPRPKDGDEIFAWDTIQEKLSFSDRFGLTLTFQPADQVTYLAIVHHLAAQAKLTLSATDLEFQALQWATRHNGRSGRTAQQFIDFLTADLALSLPDSKSDPKI